MENLNQFDVLVANWEAILGNQNNLQEKEADEGGFSLLEILLQIFLPIVLVLAFLVFAKLEVLERIEKKYNAVIGAILDEDLVESVLKLQKQKMIAALEQVKVEERKGLHIPSFEERSPMIEDGALSEELFKEFCKESYAALNDEKTRNHEVEEIYDRVLKVAKIEKSSVIAENEAFISKQIQDFLKGLVADVVRIQYRTVGEFFDYYQTLSLMQLDQLDPQLKKLRQEYIRASEAQRKVLANKIYNHLHEKLKKDLDKQKNRFLSVTWQEIRL